MSTWSFDILRQGGVDLWMLVCAVATCLAGVRVVAGRWWGKPSELGYALMTGGLVAGDAIVLGIPAFHRPAVGLVWTLAVLVGTTLVLYRPLAARVGRGRGWTLVGLRCLAVGLLVMMFFEPVLRYSQTRTPDRPLVLLVDTSGSMSVPDVQNGPTRLQSLWQTLEPQLPALRRSFALTVRTFDTEVRKLERVEDLAKVEANGLATDIGKAVVSAEEEAANGDGAVVLFSDGVDNASADLQRTIGAMRRPVHTLVIGSEQTQSTSIMNVAVESIDADEDLTVGHDTKLVVHVRSSGLANRVVDVKWAMLDAEGRPQGQINAQRLVLEPQPAGQTVELTVRPTSVGLQRIAAWIDPIPGERTTVDNRQEFQALAMDPRVKVLYVEGRARPEYRELKRAMDRDANIDVASLLRIQQDRFAASGGVAGEKMTGLPQGTAGWRKYDVIILGDLDASFLTRAQQAEIEQAVSDGSGLLMIGGQSTFGPGGYAGTPIEKALPVLAGGKDAAQETTEFVPRLTQEGAMHPAMEGLAEWFGTQDKAGEKPLPPVRGNVVVPRAKQGASVLLTHGGKTGEDGKPQIVLAVQQYGKGRSAAFTADTTYLWYLPLRGMGQESPYNRFWGQTIRWLAGADVKNRQQGMGMVGLMSKSVYTLGEMVSVKAMVRDERGDATRYATVQMELVGPDGAVRQRANLAPAESRIGLYELKLPQVMAGDWKVRLKASKEGKSLGEQTMKFTVIAPADELLQLAARPDVLAELSRKSKGFSYPLAQLPQLVNELTRQDAEAVAGQQVVVPLSNLFRAIPAMAGRPAQWEPRYDLPMQAAVVLALLMAEWILRRRWQLA